MVDVPRARVPVTGVLRYLAIEGRDGVKRLVLDKDLRNLP